MSNFHYASSYLQSNSIFGNNRMSRRIEREIDKLSSSGFCTKNLSTNDEANLPPQTVMILTPKGWEYACKIVRNIFVTRCDRRITFDKMNPLQP